MTNTQRDDLDSYDGDDIQYAVDGGQEANARGTSRLSSIFDVTRWIRQRRLVRCAEVGRCCSTRRWISDIGCAHDRLLVQWVRRRSI